MTTPSSTPDWTREPPQRGSFRSIIKLGAQDDVQVPNESHFQLLKRQLNLTPDDFLTKQDGNSPVRTGHKVTLDPDVIQELTRIVGSENIQLDDYSRVKYGHGKLQEELLSLRQGIVEKVPEAVLHPRGTKEVCALVEFCNDHRIPIYVYSGGSSVSKGLRAEKGGVTLVLSTHMNRVLEINDENQTARVQAGCMGPAFEHELNNAPELYNTRHRYTCGHFPQSFELSSVGGWVLTLGSGQASTYYGDAADLALGMEVVTPIGLLQTKEYPSSATGPKVLDILKGSEGAFGIVTELTVKIFRYMPENRKYFCYLFPSWETAVDATREISQGEFGLPAVLRISDPEETNHGMQLNKPPRFLDRFLRWRGYVPGQRCACIGTIEGDADYTALVKKKIHNVAKKCGAMRLPSGIAKEWEKHRYNNFLFIEAFTDFGLIFDTVETPVNWDTIHKIHTEVHAYADTFPHTICMSHASHFYASGANLYFIFALKGTLDDYVRFRTGMIDAMVRSGGSPSHHHGVGKLMAPWMETYLGTEQMDVLRSLKRHFDPNNILNPGGQLGLDLPDDLKRDICPSGPATGTPPER